MNKKQSKMSESWNLVLKKVGENPDEVNVDVIGVFDVTEVFFDGIKCVGNELVPSTKGWVGHNQQF